MEISVYPFHAGGCSGLSRSVDGACLAQQTDSASTSFEGGETGGLCCRGLWVDPFLHILIIGDTTKITLVFLSWR